MKMKLKVAGWLLAAAAMGIVARLLVKLSDGVEKRRNVRAEVDEAVREAVKQGGYRVPIRCDQPN